MTDKEYIASLEREIKTLKGEIDDLQEDLDQASEREKEALEDGYQKALELARNAIMELR